MKLNAISIYQTNSQNLRLKPKSELTKFPNFKCNKTNYIKELNDSILKKGLDTNNANIMEILSNPEKRKQYFEVLGSLLVSVAATITNALNNNENKNLNIIDAKSDIAMISTTDKEQEDTINNTEHLEENSEQNFEINKPRGRRTDTENKLLNFIENNAEIKPKDKNLLIELYNKFCGFNKNGYQDIQGEQISNKEIASNLLAEIEQADLTDGCNEIYQKFNTSNDTSFPIYNIKIKDKIEIIENDNPKIKEILSKYEKLNKIYIQLTQKDFLNRNKKILDKLLIDISNTEEKTISTKTLSTLNKKYSEILLDIAKINNTLRVSEKKEFYINLINNVIDTDGIEIWENNFSKSALSFNKFNELYSSDIKEIEALKGIEELVKSNDIRNFSVTRDLNKHIQFEIQLSNKKSLKESLAVISKFYTTAINKKITLETKDATNYISQQDIINEFKKDFTRYGYTSYENLVKFLYGYKHEINWESDFEKHLFETKLYDLTNIINNPKIFNNELFDMHSKLRFVERFVLNSRIDKKLENAIKEQVKIFEKDLKQQLCKGITLCEYNHYDLNAPQITFNRNKGNKTTITLDNAQKIHTIF